MAGLKTKKKYVRVKDRRQGLAPTDRPPRQVANQWGNTIRQDAFVNNWLNPSSETFANAYQSAVKAGYSTHHAKIITAKSTELEWIREARSRLQKFTPEHIIRKLEKLTDSNKDSDKIRALELLARVNGLFIDRSISQIDVQFTNSVPRPVQPSQDVIDVTPDKE